MSTRTPRNRLWRPAVAAAAAIAVTAGVAAATPDTKKAAVPPRLGLVAASDSVTLDSWKEEPGVYLDLGTYLTASGAPLELRVTRKSYKDPVVATQVIRQGTRTRTRTLPEGLVKDFSGLPGFIEVTVRDTAGRTVAVRTESFCPNNASGRVDPGAPATSKYPESCPVNPFTLGSVWGVEKGWASNTYAGYYSAPVALPAGKYTAEVSVSKRYRDIFGISDAPKTVKVTVR
ncbi:protein-lysine 6-oxidase, partial [Streptomyces sp. NPDC053705]